MAENTMPRGRDSESFPGQRLGLPPSGAGSLASWQIRITALVVDWAASMGVAVLLFGSGVIGGGGWRAWMIMAVFFVESSVLTALVSGSFGQIVTRVAVVRLDRQPLGFLRAFARALLVCLVLPAVVIGQDRRGLHDVAVNTVVIKRR
ncbi:MAG: RDD family protein [Propionibacteriaceae bacterium]